MERVRVVIADDESVICMDLREMLANLGYLVVGEAGDGRSAVNLARELRPDVVLMDVKMPDMDGIDAAKVLTEEHVAPVVLLTAFSQRDLTQVIWGVLLIAMGVLLCVKEPYAVRLSPGFTFLSFSRYFIAVLLIAAGGKKLYRLYFAKDKEPSSEG